MKKREVVVTKTVRHFDVLDGWRGLSIVAVLAAHLLPLGPKAWHLNVAAGIFGMVVFFILSGFLITSFLLKEITIPDFLLRRFFRIMPLAWLYLGLALAIAKVPLDSWLAHFLFYANWPPKHLVKLTDHLWSLCVEVEFYLGIAVWVALFGKRGLVALPVFCLAFTGLRVSDTIYVSSITYYRLDEILAGCVLALVYHGHLGRFAKEAFKAGPQLLLLLLLVLSCLQQTQWLNYFRPYLAAALIGATLMNSETRLSASLNNRYLFYLAAVSYALYIIHPLLAGSWLGSGDKLEKYAKRPLLFAVLFLLAHLSTYHYERRWIAVGKKLGEKFG